MCGPAPSEDELVKRWQPLVHKVAHRLAKQMPLSVRTEDLIQDGMIGLLQALRATTDAPPAYLWLRVRGEMLDSLRRTDWLPRWLRRDKRRIDSALAHFEHANGRQPRDSEMAQSLGVSIGEYQAMVRESNEHHVIAFEDYSDGDTLLERYLADSRGEPLAAIIGELDDRLLAEAVAALPERERIVLERSYIDGESLADIGASLGLSESRMCQIRNAGVGKVRRWLGRRGG